MLPGPPTLYAALLDHPARAGQDLSSLRLAVTGAAVVPVPLVERMRAELFREVVIAYGLTESCGTVTVGDPHADPETASRTVGRAIEGTEVIIGGPGGDPLPPGLERRGPGARLQRDARLLRGPGGDGGGPRPGGLAAHRRRRHAGRRRQPAHHRPAQGHVRRSAGSTPTRPRSSRRSPGTSRCRRPPSSAFPMPGSARSAAPSSWPGPARRSTEAEIIAFCRERLANFKVPRSVRMVADAPPQRVRQGTQSRAPRPGGPRRIVRSGRNRRGDAICRTTASVSSPLLPA